jgi:arabinogalactan endo-1,4-beta-galactosidase
MTAGKLAGRVGLGIMIVLLIAIGVAAVRQAVQIAGPGSGAADQGRSLEPVSNAYTLTMLGADVSSLQRAEDLGASYYDENGVRGDPIQILKDHGVNTIRLRVWVDPASGTNNPARVAQFAAKVKAMGFGLLIDFHYSDTWADPGKQFVPSAWAGHSLSQLETDVYNHTRDVCESLKAAGVRPDMVQIGNEINGGFLWPTGRTDNWDNLAALLKQGIGAVRACSPSTQVMLHVADAGNERAARAWFDAAKARGVAWDIIGLSYYSYWHGSMADMSHTVADLKSRFGKPVVIVETAYPFTLDEGDGEPNVIHLASQLTPGYEASPSGQAANLRDVMNAARTAGAIGVFYWEPTWTAVKGNGWDPAAPGSGDQWENQALFDYSGKALPALSEFKP